MTAYVDFTYYTDTFLGTLVAEKDFDALALKASAQIDRVTFGRTATVIDDNDDVDKVDKIKMATCAVVEVLQNQAWSGDSNGITSESQGRYSVSYGPNSSKNQSKQDQIQDAADQFLSTTNLMFKGFLPGEYVGR